MSIISSLNKFIASAATLPDFSPSLGHVYLPPPTSNRLKTGESQLDQASKENTPLLDSLQNLKKPTSSMPTSGSNYLDNQLLEETINITLKYGDEYMDEIPITGQPGDFHLASTGRKDKDKLMVPVSTRGPLQLVLSKPTTPAPPPALKTNIPPERKNSKVEKSPKTPGMPKPKRRKSKAPGVGSTATSPTV